MRDYFQLKYKGCVFKQLEASRLEFDVSLSQQARFDLGKFLKNKRMAHGSKLAAEGIKPVLCLFDNAVGKDKHQRAEVINQFHPLLRFVSSQIRQHILGQEDIYHPVVGVALDQDLVPDISRGKYVFYVDNWSIQGVKSIEKIVYLAMAIDNGNVLLSDEMAELLVNTAARIGKDWFSAANTLDLECIEQVMDDCMDTAAMLYEDYISDLINENNDRADMQEKSVNLHLKRQLDKFDEIIWKLEQKGHDKMVAPTRGRKEKLQERVRQKLLDIDKKRLLSHHSKTVSMGVISVQ